MKRKSPLSSKITRKDFIKTTLIGSGAALLNMPAPAQARGMMQRLQSQDWNGYAGVGDYSRSNGNTWEVVSAAHSIRDGEQEGHLKDVIDTGELYDLVVVGGGFSGVGAAYGFFKEADQGQSCLLLEKP